MRVTLRLRPGHAELEIGRDTKGDARGAWSIDQPCDELRGFLAGAQPLLSRRKFGDDSRGAVILIALAINGKVGDFFGRHVCALHGSKTNPSCHESGEDQGLLDIKFHVKAER